MTEKTKLSIDYVLLAFIVIFITLQPYFKHGVLNYYELGIYLPGIDALFHGEIPYKDIFILRGPLEIYIPAFFMQIFGKNISVLEAYFYFGTVLTMVLYVLLARRVYKTRIFCYLMALVFIARTFPRVNFSNWGGIRFGLGALALLSFILFLEKRTKFWILLSGIFSGLGFLISFEVGLFSACAVFTGIIFYYFFKFDRPQFNLVIFYVAGACLALIPFFTYIYIQGGVAVYIKELFSAIFHANAVINMPWLLGTPQNFKEFLSALSPFNHNIKYMMPFFFYCGICIYIFTKVIRKSVSLKDIIIISISVYGALLYYSSFRDIEGPQYLMAIQPVVVLAYLFLDEIFSRFLTGVSYKKAIAYVLLLIVACYSVAYPLQRFQKRFFIVKYFKEFFIEKKGLKIIFKDEPYSKLELDRAQGIVVPDYQKLELEKVSAYIMSHSSGRDIVFAFPDLGIYNFLTARPAPGRLKTPMFSYYNPEWHAELMKDLALQKPKFILNRKQYPEMDPFMPRIKKYQDKIHAYIDQHYKLTLEAGNIQLYEALNNAIKK
ncbi:MAG: glycosyltransferase family 39 protein [Candidatus Omnitrophota bacterium]|nr:glycosyltransferase family 39 protein [Candidatus Omnitrophota bacterium]